MKGRSYAKLYQMKPFESLKVIDRKMDQFWEYDPATFPKAEKIQSTSILVSDDHARMLVDSPHVGKLINCIPF